MRTKTASPLPAAAPTRPVAFPAAPRPKNGSSPPRTATLARRCPQQHTRGLVGALNAEWHAIVLDPAARAVVGTWATTRPPFAGCMDPAAVLDAVTRRGRDEVLLALLELAREGDVLAARIALQGMLGSAVRLARRTLAHAQGDLEESISRAVTALWQVVREYPIERRSCRPADGVSLDVLAALTAAARSRPAEFPAGLPVELADVPEDQSDDLSLRGIFWAVAHPRAADACSDEQLVLLLAWSVRRNVISVEDARLLLRLYSPREPGVAVTWREVAQELGLGHDAVRQRASRAKRRLARAVADHADRGMRDMDNAA